MKTEKPRSYQDSFKWASLLFAILLLALDTIGRTYARIDDGTLIDTTPRVIKTIWLWLIPLTFLSFLASVPRWQSFFAILVIAWVVLRTIFGHWPFGLLFG